MRILIDTHILIWYLNGSSNLSNHLIQVMQDPKNQIIVSTVSLWEITIKLGLKKLELDLSLGEIQKYLNGKSIEILNIQFNSLITLSELADHHRDPFDRLLIAQAISENLAIVSVDKHFKAYPIQLIG